MLFYRRRSLQRPVEAKGKTSHGIPETFVQEVNSLNEEFLIQRQEYDQTVNTVKLKVFAANRFVFQEILYFHDGDIEKDKMYTEISIDRRRTVSELLNKVKQVCDNNTSMGNKICRMKEWGGGFYLADQFNDEEAVLQDLGLLSDTCILIWDGQSIDDQAVDVGLDHEPIKLLLLHEENQHPVGEIIIRKSQTLQHLHRLVSDISGLDIDTFTIQTACDNEGSSDKIRNIPIDSHQLVTGAGLSNDDIIVMATPEANSTPTQQSTNGSKPSQKEAEWVITLENRLPLDTDTTNTSISLTVKSSMSIKEVKTQALEAFSIINDVSGETVRLRELNKLLWLQPPLRESLTLSDCGLSNGITLVLESGRPPQDSEMTVIVLKLVSGKLALRREFLVDRQLTVMGMLEAACKLMECEGSEWYLSKTDMYGDPTDPLDNPSSTLLDLLINEGDILVLQEGIIVRKDQVCLNVWLHADIDHSVLHNGAPMDRGDNQVNGEDKIILELAAKLSVDDHVNPDELNPLYKCLNPSLEQLFDRALIVNKSIPIDKLKLGLLETERFQTLRIPTTNFMRLRVMEGGRLRTILRTNSQVLRHVNPKDTLDLTVQTLPFEETLSQHEILLNVAQKIGGSRIYMPAKEHVWNTSGGQGAADLRRSICNKLGLPVHEIALAKYNTDNFSWLPLKDVPQKAPKGKGKKKSGSGKCNIKQAPYYVQDGDLIGIKSISSDKGILDPDDFCTQDDLDKQQLLQQIADEKRKIREEKKKESLCDSIMSVASKRRPEVPLTIKVDKFS